MYKKIICSLVMFSILFNVTFAEDNETYNVTTNGEDVNLIEEGQGAIERTVDNLRMGVRIITGVFGIEPEDLTIVLMGVVFFLLFNKKLQKVLIFIALMVIILYVIGELGVI